MERSEERERERDGGREVRIGGEGKFMYRGCTDYIFLRQKGECWVGERCWHREQGNAHRSEGQKSFKAVLTRRYSMMSCAS